MAQSDTLTELVRRLDNGEAIAKAEQSRKALVAESNATGRDVANAVADIGSSIHAMLDAEASNAAQRAAWHRGGRGR